VLLGPVDAVIPGMLDGRLAALGWQSLPGCRLWRPRFLGGAGRNADTRQLLVEGLAVQ
jgi:hypothetical protein